MNEMGQARDGRGGRDVSTGGLDLISSEEVARLVKQMVVVSKAHDERSATVRHAERVHPNAVQGRVGIREGGGTISRLPQHLVVGHARAMIRVGVIAVLAKLEHEHGLSVGAAPDAIGVAPASVHALRLWDGRTLW